VDTTQFLELVTPSGLLCIAKKMEPKGYSQIPVRSHEDAAKVALHLDSKGETVFFALASFKETHQNDFQQERVRRTRTNVDKLKSLWLDIDFKQCPQTELPGVLNKFLKDTGFPPPTLMVNSGNGVHVYWVLTEAIPMAEWLPLAQAFKALCQAYNLPADHMCTADASRVLRPPGTHNRKGEAKPVRIIYSNLELLYDYSGLMKLIPGVSDNAIPAHLRGLQSTNEFSGSNHTRQTSVKELARNCAVVKHTLLTGGAEQDEPEWNSTLLLLKYVDGGEKLVHPMSSKHIGYDYETTQEKWQQKLNAETSGPTLCSTFEGWHPEKCAGCPIYKSKKQKTPLSLAYVNPTQNPKSGTTQLPNKGTSVPNSGTPHLVSVSAQQNYPDNWRPIPGNGGVERKTYDKVAKEWGWDKVLKRTWRLVQAQRSANTGEYTYMMEAKSITGRAIQFEIPGGLAYGCPRTWEVLGTRGAILTSNEKTHWTDLMATWLQKLQEENAVLDTADQLGWIERVDDKDNKNIVGFASGGAAFFNDGSSKNSVVTANHKHKGIADYYVPVGKSDKWKESTAFLIEQGHDHIIAMLTTAFAGPLVKFTNQSGCVLSVVSNNTSAGKSLSLEAALAAWGNPKLGGMTLNDTPTSTKNKLAYLQNITAYWDEARGDEQTMKNFAQTVFQVTQGKDRERADRSARTIAAQTWHTMLVVTSNESIFDLTANATGASDAGVYRIFELFVADDERPLKDPRIASMVSELQSNYGKAGEEYAAFLAKNLPLVRRTVEKVKLKVEEHFHDEPSERFWVATMTSMIAGAMLANASGLTAFDIPKLWKYMQAKFLQLRVRVTSSRITTDPNELLNAYMMQHMHEKLVTDTIRIKAGGTYTPQLIGNYNNLKKITYQIGKDQGLMRVNKTDFLRWLHKTRGLRLTGELAADFKRKLGMVERKTILGAATQYATHRVVCLDFNVDMVDE